MLHELKLRADNIHAGQRVRVGGVVETIKHVQKIGREYHFSIVGWPRTVTLMPVRGGYMMSVLVPGEG